MPNFNANGNLPPGIFPATWQEIGQRCGTSPRRRWLLQGLHLGLVVLASVGCTVVYLDGSFVTAKQNPSDFDACYELSGMDLNLLLTFEPVFFDFNNGRAAQKARFGGEFLPASTVESTSMRTFLEFFQVDKQTGEPKGLLVIDPRGII